MIHPMTGWWLGHPSEKYELVNWDDEIPNIWENRTGSKPPTSLGILSPCFSAMFLHEQLRVAEGSFRPSFRRKLTFSSESTRNNRRLGESLGGMPRGQHQDVPLVLVMPPPFLAKVRLRKG